MTFGLRMSRKTPIIAVASAAALLASLGVGATSAAADAGTFSGHDLVAQLAVAADHTTGYDQTQFPRNIDADGDGCDTRHEVLIAESTITPTIGADCEVSGQWYSPYDDKTWTDPSDVDVDHLVPLAEAWRSGAWTWTAQQRSDFANDLDYAATLIAVTDNENESKGDSDPALWMPPNTAYRCTYVATWIQVKYRWGLSVDSAEASALDAVLAEPACAGLQVTLPDQIVAPAPKAPTGAAPAGAFVYRFWSPLYRSHFYTIDLAERDHVISTFPASVWTYEGAAYEAYTTQVAGSVPLYRFWSAAFHGHFYTTDEAEKDHVIDAYDDDVWHFEGVAYYVYPVGVGLTDTLDVARFWSPNNRHHFYTADAAEAEHVRTSYPLSEWTYEGISFVVPSAMGTPPPPPAQQPEPTPTPPPTPTPTPTPTQPANPGDTKNCSDFATYADAKAWYDRYYPYYGDVAHLDGDNDGIPCESLPGHP